jgi:hypothetical protein
LATVGLVNFTALPGLSAGDPLLSYNFCVKSVASKA